MNRPVIKSKQKDKISKSQKEFFSFFTGRVTYLGIEINDIHIFEWEISYIFVFWNINQNGHLKRTFV